MNKYASAVWIVTLLCIASFPVQADKRSLQDAVSKLPIVVGTQWPQDISFWVVVRPDTDETSSKALAELICRVAQQHGVWKFSTGSTLFSRTV